DHPLDGPGVRVEQELGRVAALPPLGVVGAVDPEAVALARADLGHVAVPGVGGDLGQAQPPLDPGLVEQGQVDGVGPLGEDGGVGALPVPGRPQGTGLPWPHGLLRGRHRQLGSDMVGVSVPYPPDMMLEGLRRTAEARGIATSFTDARGRHTEVSEATLEAVLEAMGPAPAPAPWRPGVGPRAAQHPRGAVPMPRPRARAPAPGARVVPARPATAAGPGWRPPGGEPASLV